MKKGLSASAKKEIVSKSFNTECCEEAFMSALIHSCGSLLIAKKGQLDVLVKACDQQLKQRIDRFLHGRSNIASEIQGKEILIFGEGVIELLDRLEILDNRIGIKIVSGIDYKVVHKDCCKRAYAGGIFVGAGSLSASKSGYHLEFVFEGKNMADDFLALLAELEIIAKYTERKGKHVIYLKDNESIGDCLAFCTAGKTTLEINNIYVDRQIRQLINRRTNCDIANLDRTISVGVRQAELFKRADFSSQGERMKLTAMVRIDNPEASYEELAGMLGISKSGVKHRLKKLEEIAQAEGLEK